jgi:hypothetical protein
MKTTKTFELTSEERLTVERFLKLVDEISDVTGNRSMDDVFNYFVDTAEVDDNRNYSIGSLHKLDEI